MSEQTKKTPARVKGYKVSLVLFFPVNSDSIKSQKEASTALYEAEQSGNIGGIIALPGLRLLALKSARFTSIPNDPAKAAEEAGSEAEEGDEAEHETGENDPSDTGHTDEGESETDEAEPTTLAEAEPTRRRRSA